MRIRDILKTGKSEAVTVTPDDTLVAAAQRIAERRKGLAVVCEAGKAPVGIISVIDINRAVAEHAAAVPTMLVREVMNRTVVTCTPDDAVDQALETMAAHRIRHLPVVEDGALAGIVSIRDLLEARYRDAQISADEMQRYVFGIGYR